jgi:hypothetical protein
MVARASHRNGGTDAKMKSGKVGIPKLDSTRFQKMAVAMSQLRVGAVQDKGLAWSSSAD